MKICLLPTGIHQSPSLLSLGLDCLDTSHVPCVSFVSQDDLVLLPKSLARNLSDISPLVLIKGVAAGIQVVDPFTGEVRLVTLIVYPSFS
jgi:hypothetical protein